MVTLSNNSFCQKELNTDNKKAIRKYHKALEQMNNFNNAEAKNNLIEAISADSNFTEAYLLLADMYHYNSEFSKEVELYRKLSDRIDIRYPQFYFSWGQTEFLLGNYKESQNCLRKFISIDPANNLTIEQANKILLNCEFAINSINNPVMFKPSNLGDSINTLFDEYFPSISADGEILVITSRIPIDDYSKYSIRNSQEDFLISNFHDGKWNKASNLGIPVNTKANEGAQSLSADGKLMYFTACGKANGLGSCDIYLSENTGPNWSFPINLGPPVNSIYWESTPSISADGHTLYFSSNRPGGFGKMDIWKSTLKQNGKWSEPVNLGSKINSIGDELAPFIHSDGQSLYFSSNGLTGMGGFDLFIAHLDSNGLWNETANLGYPINTYRDEQSIVVNSIGNLAFFSSDRISEKGKDIYSFELAVEVQPRKNKNWISGKKIIPGESVVLNNVFFRTDSYELDSISYTELEELYNFLRENQEIHIEIRGHTDNTGSRDYNLELSVKRARAVYMYLSNKGIELERIRYKGFGSTIPRSDNNTEEGKALNRRTEFKIIQEL
ncbi:OmpA family protein [Bacteroidota bacterium]